METHSVIFNDQDALDRYPNLQEKVNEILGWQLSYPSNDDSAKTYKYRIKTYCTGNERTWLR